MVSKKIMVYAISAVIALVLGSAAVYSLSPLDSSNEEEDVVDFEVYFFQYGGAVPPDRARLELRIGEDGTTQVIWKDWEGQVVEVYNLTLTSEEIETLKKQIGDNGFNSLEGWYTVPEEIVVIDAGVLEIGITIDGVEKEFIVNPNVEEYIPDNVSNIITELRQIISDTVQNGQKTDSLGSIKGRVLNQKGEPVSWIRIGIVNGTTYFPEIGPVTNSLGEFSFPGLLPGQFTVAAYDQEGQKIGQQVVEVLAGETTEIEFPGAKTPEKENGSIIGKVVDKDGKSLVGVKVGIINGTTSFPKMIIVTNENGVFEFPNMLQGTFVLATYFGGDIIETETVTVEEGVSSRIILEVLGGQDIEGELMKLTWVKSGGFIGISETLVINLMGYLTYNSNQLDNGELMLATELTRRDMGQLWDLVDELNYDVLNSFFKPKTNVADYFTYNLTFYTSTGLKSIVWVDDWAIEDKIPQQLADLQSFIENIVSSLNQRVNNSGDEESKAIQAAKDFILMAPTFRFDGITDSVKIGDVIILESYPIQYIVVINFESTHSGYGDREDQVLAQVITPHKAVVKLVNNEVIQAVIDGQWDELGQEELKPLINDGLISTGQTPLKKDGESNQIMNSNDNETRIR
jgi:hypothetical protein